MDYDLETAAILKALKDSDAQKATALNTGVQGDRMVSGRYVAPGVGEMMNAFVTPEIGRITEQRLLDKQRTLNEQQRGEFDTLLQQLNAPIAENRTVLKQTLRQGEGPLLQPNIDQTETQVPLTEEEKAMAQHAQRMNVGGKMLGLPMARSMGEKLVTKGADFPEQLQQLKMKQIEAGNLAAQRAQETASRNAQTDAFRQIALGMQQQGLDIRRGQVEATNQIAREKQDLKNQEAQNAKKAAVAMGEQTLQNLDTMVGQRDAQGNLVEGSMPHAGFGDYVGATWRPGMRFIEGSNASDFQAYHKQITGETRLQGVQAMKGAGQVSNAEGEAAARAISRMDKSQSEAEYIRAASEYRAIVQKGLDRAKAGIKVDATGREYAETEDGGTPGAGRPGAAPAGKNTLLTDPKSGKTVVKVDMGNGVFRYFER